MEQQKFIETVEKIRDAALDNHGKISRDAVASKLLEEGMELDESQLKMVYAYLKTSKVEVLDDGGKELPRKETDSLETPKDMEKMTEKSEEDAVLDGKSREEEFVKIYQDDIRKIAVLSEEELLKTMERLSSEKDKADKEAVINTFLKDVVRWAKPYHDGAVYMTDLIQEGNMALIGGVETFDYAKALTLDNPVKKLRDYLKKTVTEAVQNAIYAQESENNVGYKVSGRVNAVNDCARELSEEYGRKVTMEEVADKMEMSYEEIKEIVDLSANKIEYIRYS